MNKVVLTTLAMSALIILSGCSSSGSSRSSHGKYSSYDNCLNCGSGSYAVNHAHRNQRSNNSGLITAAGALVAGGLIYSAMDNDSGSSSTHKK